MLDPSRVDALHSLDHILPADIRIAIPPGIMNLDRQFARMPPSSPAHARGCAGRIGAGLRRLCAIVMPLSVTASFAALSALSFRQAITGNGPYNGNADLDADIELTDPKDMRRALFALGSVFGFLALGSAPHAVSSLCCRRRE